jgi:hypothetical protein
MANGLCPGKLPAKHRQDGDRPPADNRHDLHELAASRQSPGLLASDGDIAVTDVASGSAQGAAELGWGLCLADGKQRGQDPVVGRGPADREPRQSGSGH